MNVWLVAASEERTVTPAPAPTVLPTAQTVNPSCPTNDHLNERRMTPPDREPEPQKRDYLTHQPRSGVRRTAHPLDREARTSRSAQDLTSNGRNDLTPTTPSA